jgi:hypothetical protein
VRQIIAAMASDAIAAQAEIAKLNSSWPRFRGAKFCRSSGGLHV